MILRDLTHSLGNPENCIHLSSCRLPVHCWRLGALFWTPFAFCLDVVSMDMFMANAHQGQQSWGTQQVTGPSQCLSQCCQAIEGWWKHHLQGLLLLQSSTQGRNCSQLLHADYMWRTLIQVPDSKSLFLREEFQYFCMLMKIYINININIYIYIYIDIDIYIYIYLILIYIRILI